MPGHSAERPEFDYQHPVYLEACRAAFVRSNGMCQYCGERKAVHVHHWALDYPPEVETTPYDLTPVCLECHDRVTYRRQYGRWPEQEERSTLLDLPATARDGGIESLYAQLRHPSSTYRYALAMRDVDPDRGYFAMPLGACCKSVNSGVEGLLRTSIGPRHGLLRALQARFRSFRGFSAADTMGLASRRTFATGS